MKHCERGHGVHFGERCPMCEAIVDLAIRIGRHWRNQDGVSGALLDGLARLVHSDEGECEICKGPCQGH